MSSARLDDPWSDEKAMLMQDLAGASQRGMTAQEQMMQREIARSALHLRCPDCRSIIYSRRSKLCGICGRELPEEFLFSPAEAARLEKMLASERSRHRKWMSRSFNPGTPALRD